jgi:methylated-DNA-[protein]-cysteine S-methyltransferase
MEKNMFYSTKITSPLGKITFASDGENLVGLWFDGQKYFGSGLDLAVDLKANDAPPVFDAAKKWLERYFAGKRPDPSELPLAPQGGEFRQAVWNILRSIPYGKTMTYGEIAKKVAKKLKKETMSSQAVGGAVGRNPISIIIPCHRVVGTDGGMTGYAGGIDKKIKLLELEKALSGGQSGF